jgi:hypothetical protein
MLSSCDLCLWTLHSWEKVGLLAYPTLLFRMSLKGFCNTQRKRPRDWPWVEDSPQDHQQDYIGRSQLHDTNKDITFLYSILKNSKAQWFRWWVEKKCWLHWVMDCRDKKVWKRISVHRQYILSNCSARTSIGFHRKISVVWTSPSFIPFWKTRRLNSLGGG